jgi:hypothetical protein
MRFLAAVVLFGLISGSLAVQTSAPSAALPQSAAAASANSPAPVLAAIPAAPPLIPIPPQISDTKIGFSYGLPADWQTQASQMTKPDVPYPTVEAPKKGNACTQVELTARHGTPSSVVVVVALPFDCYGQTLTDKNLADLATGASEGLKQTFDVTNPVVSSYTLGGHTMWIERASGTVKGQPAAKYTVEIVCTVLQKGMACWWMMAADEASLQTFEQQPVTLEGDAFDAIVPAGALQAPAPAANKPS